MRRFSRPFLSVAIAAACALTVEAAAPAPKPLLPMQEVLGRIERVKGDTPSRKSVGSEAAQLMQDLEQFRAETASLADTAAAEGWLALFDRARRIGEGAAGDFGSYDLEILGPVGVRSVFVSLPPPSAWPALDAAVARRIAKQPDQESLALRFFTQLLAGDHAAAGVTLDALQKLADNQRPGQRELTYHHLATSRSRLANTYGTPDEIVAAFEQELKLPAKPYQSIRMPDLVALVGAERASAIITRAIASNASLHIEGGDATRKLAGELALKNIETMRKPQWALAESVDGWRLYEAIEARFNPTAKMPVDEEEGSSELDDYQKAQATAWYFMSAVIDGRQATAERALAALGNDSQVYLPRDAVDALRRAGKGEALYRFLDAQLRNKPQLRAWQLYVEQAAMDGHSTEALALIDATLARKDLPEFLVADLRVRRVSALLAADKVKEASAAYRTLLAKAPTRTESTLDARFEAALDAAGVGRLTGDASLSALGLDFARQALAVKPVKERDYGPSSDDQSKLWRELRKHGRLADAQASAIDELSKSSREGFEALGGFVPPNETIAMIELAGISHQSGQHAEVLKLLDESTRWGVADAGMLLDKVDSTGVPLGVMIASALRATGDRAGALRVARATVSHLPGQDAAYEIIAALDPSAAATFDALFALDEYEERPLIWKAAVQLKAGAVGDAEATIRRAIAIDPSDGEQGKNDRMRAYAVLSDILARKGDEAGAQTYRTAVDAIRLSEKADDFHEAGMYERAFKGYRDALGLFADAYCIQSRLAVQLDKQGRRAEAMQHYRRAYELMPDSFGRVESHCFGCESVFQGAEAQSVAEQVFENAIRKSPQRAQAYYLIAYLREQQQRPADAVQPLRQAVSLDPRYLNAWAHLYSVGEHTYIEPAEMDIVRLKLLELDPQQRHVRYSVAGVGNLAALWHGAEGAHAAAMAAKPPREGVYELRASAASRMEAERALPPEMREQMELLNQFHRLSRDQGSANLAPAKVLSEHEFAKATLGLMGIDEFPDY